ncbi:TPM domain-containing protein [Petrachloros mirabilis]
MIGNLIQLTEQDRERISRAVREAERRTNAEIVPMLVERSGLYRDAQHRTGLGLALLVLTSLLMLEAKWLPWGWHGKAAAWLVLGTLIAYGIGTWLGTFGSVILAVTSTERLHQKVRLRAERAFARHGISRTRDRTGVLIMLSILERQVFVLPDSEVSHRVANDEWNDVVSAVTGRLRNGDIIGGLCAGIERAGTVLARACPVRSNDNPNELSNELIQDS